MIAKRLAMPIKICGKQVQNRIVVPPISDFGIVSPTGKVTDRHIKRYSAFSKGGAGLIIIEACSVLKMHENRDTIFLEDDTCITGMKRISDAIHNYSAVTLVQIMLTGLATMTENSIAEISSNNFMKYKEAFIQAAIRCQKAGFDGVELHAAHGMYLDEVIETSTRNDEYGGSFENRSRLLTELIAAIKENCGCDFIVAVRFGNSNYDELIKTAQVIEKAGADLLDISSGMNQYQIPIEFKYDSKVYAASLVKAQSQLPVICVGNIFNADDAENILKENLADMVAVGRGSLADPFWAKKVLSNVEPNYCRQCKRCMWWIDGNLCPVRKKEVIQNGL